MMILELQVPFERVGLLLEHTRAVVEARVNRSNGWTVVLRLADPMAVMHALYVALAEQGPRFAPGDLMSAVDWHRANLASVAAATYAQIRDQLAESSRINPSEAGATILMDRLGQHPAESTVVFPKPPAVRTTTEQGS